MSGANAPLDIGQNGLSVGQGGSGSLIVSAGGTVRSASTNSLNLSTLASARAAGSTATITVTGTGSSITATGYVYIGRAGTAALLVDQGGSFVGGRAAVADGIGINGQSGVSIGDGELNVNAFTGIPNNPVYFGGSSSARVQNGSTLRSLGSLTVGRNGSTGTLVVDSGSTVAADTEIQVGSGTDRPGAVGTVTVQGGSLLKSGTTVVTGSAGLRIGGDAGNTGTLTVTGGNSRIDSGGARVTVGAGGGTGTLNVLAGASVKSGAAYSDTEAAFNLGANAGSSGTVMVSGTGSSFVAGGQAVLGGGNGGTGAAAGGTGTLSVQAGGLFRAVSLTSFAGGTLNVDATGIAVIGTSAGVAGQLLVDAGATVSGSGAIHATVRDNGSITATGGALTIDAIDAAGTGTVGINGGSLQLGRLGGQGISFTGVGAIRIAALTGNGTVTGFSSGDVLDFGPGLTTQLQGNVLTVRSQSGVATETFTGLTAGLTLTLGADGQGGQQVTAVSSPYTLDNGDGTSTQYVPNPTATVAKTITHFAALNGTGAVLSTIIDNADQSSLIYAYKPTTTVKQTATQFTGTDPNTGAPAGSKVSVVIDNTDGTSLVYAYNPSSTVTQTTTKFSATNPDGSAAGTKVSAVVDNTDGTSLVYAYNPTATVKQVTTRFSATDPTNGAPAGVRLSDVVDNTDGTALVYAYNLNSAIRLTATLYSGTDPNNGAPTGNAVSLTIDYTTNQSSVQAFNADGSSNTTYYSGPDGTGSVIPNLSGSAKAVAAPISTGSLGVGAGPSQFLPGAAAATVLPAVPTIIGFDASANQLDLSALLASDSVTLAYESGAAALGAAQLIAASPAALLPGFGGTATDATMVMIKGA